MMSRFLRSATRRAGPWTLVLAFAACTLALPDTTYPQVGSLRVSVPSPTAASLGKFGDVPVSLYTGVPEISIPLFSVRGRTLELPIRLAYHASGIKVEELGSWVGMGWSLEAGGTITRSVRGVVDDHANGYYGTGHSLWDNANWPSPSAATLNDIRLENIDAEPDQFFYSFGGRSGQIVIGPTSSSPSIKEHRAIPHQNLKIEPQFSPGEISSWVITAEDGTRYTFAAKEISTDYNSVSGSISSHFGEQYVSSWHLTEVRSVGGDVITLSYAPYVARHRFNGYEESMHQRTGPSCGPASLSGQNEFEVGALRLSSIASASHTVSFTPAAALRTDALSPGGTPQEPRLERIGVSTPSGVVLRSFLFEHSYSTGRLTLTRLTEQDRFGNSLPPYTFAYEAQGLPSSTSKAQDHWDSTMGS